MGGAIKLFKHAIIFLHGEGTNGEFEQSKCVEHRRLSLTSDSAQHCVISTGSTL